MASLVYDNQILTDEPDETKENSYVDHFFAKAWYERCTNI